MWRVTAAVLALLALCFVGPTVALSLPDYVKPCARNDPQLNECAKLHAQAAVPFFIKGDRKYKIPVMDPLYIPEMTVHQDTTTRAIGLGFVATDLYIRGLANVNIEEIKLDLEKDYYEYYLQLPHMEVKSKYNVSGRVLILPIAGSGNAHFKFDDVRMVYKYNIQLEERNGANYSLIKNPVFEFDVKKGMTMNLENLFNGDQALGKQMNLFLNENWKEVLLDIGPAIAETMGQIMTIVLGEIYSTVPYADAWLPDKV